MLRNHLVLAFRNLRRQKASAAINIFGLSVAVACTLVVFLFVRDKLDRESMHERGDRIFLVEGAVAPGAPRRVATPVPLGPALAADLSEVVRAVRLDDGHGTVRQGDTEIGQWVRFVDPAYFEMFSFPFAAGDERALYAHDGAVLSAEAALRYFGDAPALGAPLTIRFGEEERTFVVSGVVAEHPSSTGLRFSIALPFAHRPGGTEWTDATRATFVELHDPAQAAALPAAMAPYLARQQAALPEEPVVGYALHDLYGMAKSLSDARGALTGIPWAPIVVLSVLAGFLLVLSCVNYVNIALAAAARRFREIGVRKVVGSGRAGLVAQFMTENLVLCALALVAGAVLAHGWLVPAFNDISGDELSLFGTAPGPLWAFLAALLVGVGLLSGAYPALYVSAFEPIEILRGRSSRGTPRRFMQGLLGLQFVLAFLTMIACMGLLLNAEALRERDWGYDRTDLVVVPVPEVGAFGALAEAAGALPDVTAATGAASHVGTTYGRTEVQAGAETIEPVVFGVAPGYTEALGLRLAEGRFFAAGEGTAAASAVINASFARAQGWEAPLGQGFRADSTTYTVVGVVEDFHHSDFSAPITPVFFRVAEAGALEQLVLRVRPGTADAVEAALEAAWAEVRPDVPLAPYRQTAVFDHFFEETAGITRLFLFVAALALAIACLGLYGLAAQHTASRLKEVSIRKVLGAGLGHLAVLVNRRYAVLVLVAAAVATPLGFVGLGALLDSIYTYRMSLGPAPFLLAYACVLGTGLVAVASQVRRVAVANPADLLRSE